MSVKLQSQEDEFCEVCGERGTVLNIVVTKPGHEYNFDVEVDICQRCCNKHFSTIQIKQIGGTTIELNNFYMTVQEFIDLYKKRGFPVEKYSRVVRKPCDKCFHGFTEEIQDHFIVYVGQNQYHFHLKPIEE